MLNCASACEHMSEVPGYWVVAHKSAGLVGLGCVPLPLSSSLLSLSLFRSVPPLFLTSCLSPFPCILNCLFGAVKKALHTQQARGFAFNGAVKRRRCRRRLLWMPRKTEKGNVGGGCGRLTWHLNWAAYCICIALLTVLCCTFCGNATLLHLVSNAWQIPKVATCHADFCGTCRDLWQINC